MPDLSVIATSANQELPIEISLQHWQEVQKILQPWLAEYTVWAYGSRATFTAKKFSDLDLAFVGSRPLDLASLAKLTIAFEESNLPWRVDILDWATATPEFKHLIQNHWVRIA